ncbi:MAG: hypothetical protein U1E76_09335 [Planctomycetota bacterium]
MKTVATCLCLSALLGALALRPPAAGSSATPAEFVSSYSSLADAILAVKKTEANLVMAILAATYQHAEGDLHQALAKIKAGQPAKDEVETVAALVSQLGNEGDSAIAGVRKRLLEGGHHHNAAGEQKGIFDEGFVIVTKEAKKVFLEAASAIGKLAGSATADALNAQWDKVKAQWAQLGKGTH